MQDIQSWINDNLIDAIVNDKVVTVNGVGNFLVVEEKYFIEELLGEAEVVRSYFESYQGKKKERVFDDKFRLILNNDEVDIVSNETLNIQYFLFSFGDRWYYCDDWEFPVLNEFKYLGTAKKELEMEFPFLGVHGGYELCSGSRLYKDWCKKARYLGIKTLGICEENTLAGTLDFQNSCKEAGIKSIIGETITVKGEKLSYPLKLYVQNETGWKNLLRINAEINVHNKGFVTLRKLADFAEGLICIIPPDAIELFDCWHEYQNYFDGLYFQLDLCEWDNQERDAKWLGWIKTYLDKYYNDIPLLLISDAYYLDKGDSGIKRLLHKIGDVRFKYSNKNQWFKSLDEIFLDVSELFSAEDPRLFEVIEKGVENLNNLVDSIDFKIEIGKLRLPKYKMTEEEFAKYNGNPYDMIVDLIGQGFEKKIAGKVQNEDAYWERIEEELEVIHEGNLEDYFLILWDIVNFCKRNNIWVGIGRGCFTPDMKVKMHNGEFKEICKVSLDEKVKNYFNGISTIKNVFEYEIDEEIVELQFDNGVTISCTKDHKIFTQNRGWIAADELSEFDVVQEAN